MPSTRINTSLASRLAWAAAKAASAGATAAADTRAVASRLAWVRARLAAVAAACAASASAAVLAAVAPTSTPRPARAAEQLSRKACHAALTVAFSGSVAVPVRTAAVIRLPMASVTVKVLRPACAASCAATAALAAATAASAARTAASAADFASVKLAAAVASSTAWDAAELAADLAASSAWPRGPDLTAGSGVLIATLSEESPSMMSSPPSPTRKSLAPPPRMISPPPQPNWAAFVSGSAGRIVRWSTGTTGDGPSPSPTIKAMFSSKSSLPLSKAPESVVPRRISPKGEPLMPSTRS